jgi:uncharacterized membrane protein YhaH (DUF805 family)
MSLGKKLFGFQGRLRRRDWWLLSILLIVAQWVVSSLAVGATGGLMGGAWGGHWGAGAGPSMMFQDGAGFGSIMQRVLLIQVVTAALFLWPSVAVSVKRLHDRNHTGWWLVLPYALGCARGGLMFAAFSRFGGGGFGHGFGMMGGGWRGQWGMMDGHWGGMQSHWFTGPPSLWGLHLGLGLALLIVALWLLVELGFLDGTRGPNRFGPSPKGIGEAAA